MRVSLDDVEVSLGQRHLLREVFLDAVPLFVPSLLESLQLFLVVNESHVEVVLFSFQLVQRSELSLLVEGVLDVLGQLDLGDDDIGESEALVVEHLVQEVFHSAGVRGTLDLVHFEVGLASNQHAHSLRDRGFELFVELVDRNLVGEVIDSFFFRNALEHNGDVQGYEDVVVGGAGAHGEPEHDVLLSDQELDLGPGHAPNQAAGRLSVGVLSVGCDNGVSSFGPGSRLAFMDYLHIDVGLARTSGRNEHDGGFSLFGVVSEPLSGSAG